MLEQFFVKPSTVDRFQLSWIGTEIDAYVVWLTEHGYGLKSVWRRVPIVYAFGEHAQANGAVSVADLPRFVEGFIPPGSLSITGGTVRSGRWRKRSGRPIEQMLSVVLAGFVALGRSTRPFPLTDQVPGFVEYLVDERGLRPKSVDQYRHHLDRFDVYLQRIGARVADLSPALVSAFMVDRASVGLARSTVRDCAGVLRVFVRFAHRSGILNNDLSAAVGWPQVYRLSKVPRSISWDDVNRVLAAVDRRTPVGGRRSLPKSASSRSNTSTPSRATTVVHAWSSQRRSAAPTNLADCAADGGSTRTDRHHAVVAASSTSRSPELFATSASTRTSMSPSDQARTRTVTGSAHDDALTCDSRTRTPATRRSPSRADEPRNRSPRQAPRPVTTGTVPQARRTSSTRRTRAAWNPTCSRESSDRHDQATTTRQARQPPSAGASQSPINSTGAP